MSSSPASTQSSSREPQAIDTGSRQESRRACWECLRRRLVCDCSRPNCKRCQRDGIVCPGFGDKKPLTWVTPGKVTSRSRKKRPSHGGSRKVNGKPESERSCNNSLILKCAESNNSLLNSWSDCQESVEFISRTELKTDDCKVGEAIHYYNSQMYPQELLAQLGPSPFIAPIWGLHMFPPSLSHGLACIAVSHRVVQLEFPRVSGSNITTSLAKPRSRLQYHRGLAIRALNEEIGKEGHRGTDRLIASVMVLLHAELGQAASSDWQSHYGAALTLIKLRGGYQKLLDSAPAMAPAFLSLVLLGIIGNTTSPPSTQITAFTHSDWLDLYSKLFSVGTFPTFPCPPPLIEEIIHINHLRQCCMNTFLVKETKPGQSLADSLLEHINNFCPEQWAESKKSYQDDWLLIARIYQSAVALYCICSLQRDLVLLPTSELRILRRLHNDRLLLLLEKAMTTRGVMAGMMWPLIVAGVEAARGNLKTRTFVAKSLESMTRNLGTALPLFAREVLRNHWASGKTAWDDCFARPYAFLY